MKKKNYSVIFFLFTISAQSQSVIGKWKTIDDETQKPASYVEIYEEDGKFYGKVLEILKEDTKPDAVCEECTDDRKDQPIVGMQIIRGLKKKENQWTGGTILDPNNGKVYKCYLELEERDKLKLRGYVGFSLIGRTQYWYRESHSAD